MVYAIHTVQQTNPLIVAAPTVYEIQEEDHSMFVLGIVESPRKNGRTKLPYLNCDPVDEFVMLVSN